MPTHCCSSLIEAAKKDHVVCVKLFIPYEAGKQDEAGMTALMYAAAQGYVEIVESLIPYEAGLKDLYDETALIRAAENGHPECVKLLMDKEARIFNDIGMTALTHAAEFGHLDCVKLLVNKEAGLQHDDYGRTALMWATAQGYVEIVEFLIPYEAGKQDDIGMTALMTALEFGSSYEPKWVKLDKLPNIDNYNKCVELLLPHESHSQDKYNKTHLMYAAENGNIKGVKLFIDKEAGLKDNNGYTALMYAAKNGFANIVELLMDKEVGKRDINGRTALMLIVIQNKDCLYIVKLHELYASDEQNFENIEFSNNNEIVPNYRDVSYNDILSMIQDHNEKRPIHMKIILKCFLKTTKLIIPYEVGLKDNYGRTALMYAAMKGYNEIAKLLIPQENYIQDYKNVTALMYAAYNGNIEIVELLVDKEAGLKDDNGYTALMYAIEKNHPEIVKLLLQHEKVDNNILKCLFIKINLPMIPIKSFLDVLNKAAKQSGKNYDNSMVEISDKLEKLSVSVLQEYLNISNIKELESRLINDFPEYKEKIPSIIKELETEKLVCPICLDESKTLYRNCVNCTGFACKDCWKNILKCFQCNTETLKWTKCLNIEMIKLL